jgi:hypothetical protein
MKRPFFSSPHDQERSFIQRKKSKEITVAVSRVLHRLQRYPLPCRFAFSSTGQLGSKQQTHQHDSISENEQQTKAIKDTMDLERVISNKSFNKIGTRLSNCKRRFDLYNTT